MPRLSVLVNVWTDHKPEDVRRMTNGTVRSMKGWTPTQPLTTGLARQDIAEIRYCAKRPRIVLEEHVHGDTQPLPMREVKAASKARGVLKVNY